MVETDADPAVDAVAEMVRAAPGPALGAHVHSYIGYRYERFAPGTHQGLPSRHLTFIVSLGDPIDLTTMMRPDDAPVAMYGMASGLAASPVTVTHDGNQIGIQLELSPFGCRALLGAPASDLYERVVDLDDLLGSLAGELHDRLRSYATWAERFAIVDDVLTRAVEQRPRRAIAPPAPELTEAWRRIVASHGAITIGELADEVGWSRRHLAHRFTTELGLSPKTAARVVRFERAKSRIQATFGTPLPSPTTPSAVGADATGDGCGHRPTLADLAAECGYYDQAHLNREFRELAGRTPTQWLAEELPSVQDIDLEQLR